MKFNSPQAAVLVLEKAGGDYSSNRRTPVYFDFIMLAVTPMQIGGKTVFQWDDY